MAYPQHTTIIPDDAFEAALSHSNEEGILDNDDWDLVLDLDISGRSNDLDEIQLNHTILYNSPAIAINSNRMDYKVLSDLNRSSFDMETMLMDLSQQQLVQPAENDGLNGICLLEKIKDSYNPCRSNHHRSSLPGPVYIQHRVRSVSDDLESDVDLALKRFTARSGMISHQSTPKESTPVAVDSTMAPSRRFRRRNAICHRF